MKRLSLFVQAMMTLGVIACGQPSAPGGEPDPTDTASTATLAGVTLAATPTEVLPGAAVQLLPTFNLGTGAISPGVGWVASGVPVTVRPSATTTYTLTVKRGSRRATATATVAVKASISVSISPAQGTVEAGRSLAFVAAVQNAANPAVTWSVQEAGGGTVGADGIYVAPASAGTFHVVAASVEDPARTAVATVDVTLPPPSTSTAIAVYRDALEAGWQDWSWATHDLAATAPVSSGSRAISVTYDPWAGLSFDLPGGISGLGNGTLRFDVNGGANVLPAIHAFVQSGGAWLPEVDVSPYCAGGGIATNQFTRCSVPLAALQAASGTFDRIAFKEAVGRTLAPMSFDEIVLEPEASAPAPAIQAFTASPASVVAGSAVTLSASYSGGAGTIDNGVGALASGASVSVKPAATTTYTLAVSNSAGQTARASVTVTVSAAAAPAIQAFAAAPGNIAAGGSATLSATYSGGAGTIDNGVGALASGASVSVKPAATTTYTLTVSDTAGHSATSAVTVTVGAASSTALLSADRLTAWVPGMMAAGGVPARSTVCATLNASTYGNGLQEASAAIQAAVDACPAGQVVLLSAGTFRTNNHVLIDKAITLRGAGAGVTILKKTNGAVINQEVSPDAQPIVVIGPNRWPHPDETSARNLAADGAKGAFAVTMSSATGFAAGQIVLLDELSGASWQPDLLGRGKIWASSDYRVVWQFHNPAFGADDPLVATTPTGGGAASWFSRQDRVTAEWKEIASVSGNVVTFTTPLHIDYRASHGAQLTRNPAGSLHVKNAGVEDLTAIGGSDGAIRFEAAAYSWAKGVEVTVWQGEGFAVNNSFRVEVRDSYVHDAAWAQPGGAGYAISLANGSAEALFENNISIMANKVMVARCAGAGSVFGYNYVDAGYINTVEGWIEIGLNASHMVGPHHVLFEGNYGFNWDSDHTHGNSIFHTVFRNHLRCVRKPFTNPMTGHTVDDAAQSGNGPRRCAGATAYSYGMSFVGNVLGAQGQMGGFTYDATGPDGMSKSSIWLLGWDDMSPQPYDASTAATTVRHGNFDYLTNSVAWDPAKPDHTLPDSLYLSQKPAFFNAGSGYTWPWVDPAGATKVRTLPAKARYDAGTPFRQP